MAGTKYMNGGIAVLVVFTMIALLIAIGGVALGDPTFSSIAMINVLLGALIGFPLVFVGTARVRRATRFLSGSHERVGQGVVDRVQPTNELLTTGLNSDAHRVPLSASVTEHTTHSLAERGDDNDDARLNQRGDPAPGSSN
jgi:hypothetical protein